MFRQIVIVSVVGAALIAASPPVVAATRHASHAPAGAVAGAVDRDGPFGIFIGEPIADLGPLKVIGPGLFDVLHPARPSSLFNEVTVNAFPGMGVCQIEGVTSAYEFDNEGSLARASADNIAQILTAKYGPAAKTDTCDGSDTECGEGWAEAIREKNADYYYHWKFQNPRQDKIGIIEVAVYAENAALTHVQVAYFSADLDGCEQAKKAAAAGSL